jgi:hypothetical protein
MGGSGLVTVVSGPLGLLFKSADARLGGQRRSNTAYGLGLIGGGLALLAALTTLICDGFVKR